MNALTEAEAARLTKRIELRLVTIADNTEAVIVMIEDARNGSADQALGYASWTAYVAEKFGGALARLGKVERLPFVELMADQGMSTRAIGEVVGVSKDTVSRDLRAGVSNETPEQTMIPKCQRPGHGWHPDGRCPLDGDGSPGVNQLTPCPKCSRPLEWSAPGCDEPHMSPVPTDEQVRHRDSVKAKTSTAATAKTMGKDGKAYTRPDPKPPRRRPLPDSYRDASYKLLKSVESVERLHMDDRLHANRETLLARNRFELLQAHKKLTAICADLGVDTGAEPPVCRDCGNKLVLGPPSRLREIGAEPHGDDAVLQQSGGSR